MSLSGLWKKLKRTIRRKLKRKLRPYRSELRAIRNFHPLRALRGRNLAYYKGLKGERIACRYLKARGYEILEKRLRMAGGEVDLIAQETATGTIAFVEVKYRPDGMRGSGREAVTWDKRKRIIRVSRIYLKGLGRHRPPGRFDVLEITGEGVMHYPAAFHISRRG